MVNDLVPVGLLPASPETLAMMEELQEWNLKRPQVRIDVVHKFHAGTYSRTMRVPAGVLLTAALVKIPTLLIISGKCRVLTEGGYINFDGYYVIEAPAGRKMACLAFTDTWATMIFATKATTVEEAEREFTDEHELLFSRRQENDCRN